jgi:hypothetical protein
VTRYNGSAIHCPASIFVANEDSCRFVQPIDDAIKAVQRLAPGIAATFATSTDAANQALIVLEAESNDAVRMVPQNLTLAQVSSNHPPSLTLRDREYFFCYSVYHVEFGI